MKRVALFVLTNILILGMITVIFEVFGLSLYLEGTGINFPVLIIFSAIFGFGGAFISLLSSKWVAKTFMGVRVIDPDKAVSGDAKWIVDTVHDLSRKAGLEKMPEVAVWESEEVNAFATGPGRNNSLVAVSTGLLRSMDRGSVEGVIAHEVAHIDNGDMVTMALLQGVINTFVIFLARVAAFIVGRFINEDLSFIIQFVLIMAFQTVFSILGSLVVMGFSRYREYHADADGARLAGKDKMISALESLKNNKELVDKSQPALATMKISGGETNWMQFFASHPPLEDRIARLKAS